MVEIFSSKIVFSPSILDYEKNVSRTLNSRDDSSLKERDFLFFILFKEYSYYRNYNNLK